MTNNLDCVGLDLVCAESCRALARGMGGSQAGQQGSNAFEETNLLTM